MSNQGGATMAMWRRSHSSLGITAPLHPGARTRVPAVSRRQTLQPRAVAPRRNPDHSARRRLRGFCAIDERRATRPASQSGRVLYRLMKTADFALLRQPGTPTVSPDGQFAVVALTTVDIEADE